MNKQVILAVVLFYVVSNPATYKLVDSFLGRFFRIARNGSPTSAGLLVHAAVFGALLMFILPKISGLKHTHEHEHKPPGAISRSLFKPPSKSVSRQDAKKRQEENNKKIEEAKKKMEEAKKRWEENRKKREAAKKK